jgi:predicted AAA+ superfamily ATPase
MDPGEAVLAEIVRALVHKGMEPRVYFWSTSSGTELDFIVEAGGKPVPIEMKLSATPRPAMAASIGEFQEDFGGRALPDYVVHSGDVRLPLGAGMAALPFSELWAGVSAFTRT